MLVLLQLIVVFRSRRYSGTCDLVEKTIASLKSQKAQNLTFVFVLPSVNLFPFGISAVDYTLPCALSPLFLFSEAHVQRELHHG